MIPSFSHVCLLLIDQLALGGGLAIDIREIGFDADSVGVHEGSLNISPKCSYLINILT
jgi:hypothetical protein